MRHAYLGLAADLSSMQTAGLERDIAVLEAALTKAKTACNIIVADRLCYSLHPLSPSQITLLTYDPKERHLYFMISDGHIHRAPLDNIEPGLTLKNDSAYAITQKLKTAGITLFPVLLTKLCQELTPAKEGKHS